jgi:putative Holliday junction resolvase
MKYVGVDYGRKKVGLSIADTNLAEPYKVVRGDKEKLFAKVSNEIKKTKAEICVVGLSEGRMEEEVREFGDKLSKESGIPVEFQDETLTTRGAQEMSIAAGIGRKKRKALEDAYSATLILQDWLDSKQ